MPDTGRRWRWGFTVGMIGALSIVVIVLSTIVLVQNNQINEQDARLDTIETGTVIAEVATCYASARGRPLLGDLLMVVGAAANTSEGRRVVNEAISQYVDSARTVAECDQLALDRGLDPKDFPPPGDGQ